MGFLAPVAGGAIAPLIPLHRVGPPRVSELAEALGLDRTTVTRHLDALEPRGLITRRPDERDRRAMMVNLTPAAASHLDARQARNRQRVRRIRAEWTPEEREMFGRLLPRFARESEPTSAARPTRRNPRQRDRPQAADGSNSPSTTSPRRLSGRHVRDLGSGRPVCRRRPGVPCSACRRGVAHARAGCSRAARSSVSATVAQVRRTTPRSSASEAPARLSTASDWLTATM